MLLAAGVDDRRIEAALAADKMLIAVLADLAAHGESSARQVAVRVGLQHARDVYGALTRGKRAHLACSWRHEAGGPVLWSLPVPETAPPAVYHGTAAANPADAGLLA